MFEINLKWRYQDIWDFVVFFTLRKTFIHRVLFVSYIVFSALTAVLSVVFYVITKEIKLFLGLMICFTMTAAFAVLFVIVMTSMAKTLSKANEGNKDLSVLVTEQAILLKKNQIPNGIIEWETIKYIFIEKKAAYLMNETNTLLLLAYEDILDNDKDGLIDMLNKIKNKINANG